MDYLLIGAEAASAVMDHLITLCEGMLAPVLEKAGVPESHGLEHATRVAAHVRAAAELMSGISMADVIALEVAALLHDADDSKYFDTSGELTNAQTIVDTLCETVSKEMSDDAAKRFKEICLTAIHLTSTRKHGMDVPDEYKDEVAKRPFLRFVSIADKLDAVGSRGVYRCFAYTVEQCQPIYNKGSPQPQTCDEVHLIASDERLAEYRSRSGNSTSMIDHYFDKLLQVARSLLHISAECHGAGYFERAASMNLKMMEEIVMARRPDKLRTLLQKCVRKYHPMCTGECEICSAVDCPFFSPDHYDGCSWCEKEVV